MAAKKKKRAKKTAKKSGAKKKAKKGRTSKQKAAWTRNVKKAKAFVAKWGDTV